MLPAPQRDAHGAFCSAKDQARALTRRRGDATADLSSHRFRDMDGCKLVEEAGSACSLGGLGWVIFRTIIFSLRRRSLEISAASRRSTCPCLSKGSLRRDGAYSMEVIPRNLPITGISVMIPRVFHLSLLLIFLFPRWVSAQGPDCSSS
jgi:hypothetical protein